MSDLSFDFLPVVHEGFRPAVADRGGADPTIRPVTPDALTPPNTEAIELISALGKRDEISPVALQQQITPPKFESLTSTITSNVGGLAGLLGGVAGGAVDGRRGPGYHTAVNPSLTSMISTHGRQIMAAIGKPNDTAGQWRDVGVRPPGGAAKSYHYDGLALDVPLDAGNQRDSVVGDRLAAWVRANSGVGRPFRNVIWKSANHFDHVHITYNPDYTGALPQIPRFG